MSTNNVKRYVMAASGGEAVAFPQGPGAAVDAWAGSILAENDATEFVLASDYDALAASHAELVTQRDELIASIEKITPWLSSYMKSCGTFFGDAFICRLELKEVEDTVTRIKSISALTRAKAVTP